MTNNGEENVYARLGARPVINAAGNTTVWGGSTPSPVVMQAMQEAGQSFVAMEELLEDLRSSDRRPPGGPRPHTRRRAATRRLY